MPLDDLDYRSAKLTSTKIWQGDANNRPAEIDAPSGVPSGLIVMWHGTIVNIPAGWVICDGNNSTPNLLTSFVEGVATAATNPGATGGAVNQLQDYKAGGVGAMCDSGANYWSGRTDARPPYYDVAFLMKS